MTLTRRLVATAVLLVALATLVIGTATAFSMRSWLNHQLDEEVSGTLERSERGLEPGGPGDGPFDPYDRDRDGDIRPGDVRGQGIDSITAEFPTTGSPSGSRLADRGGQIPQPVDLDSAVLDALSAVSPDGEAHTVDLPGLGSYRVKAVDRPDGTMLVAGLPDEEVGETVANLVRLELLIGLLGVLAAAGLGLLVVRRQLAPLRDVAATAESVSRLPLARGEIDLAERVPDRLTDERNEVGQVGASLNRLLDHVESALGARHRSEQQVRQFVADASHELRTPLATIAGYTELAQRRPEDADAARTALAKVRTESARMTALVADLLTLARLDQGRELERSPVDLTRTAMEAVADARVLAPDHEWRLDLPAEPVEASGDPTALHQVLTNLVTNARKYTPAGTTVTVGAARAGDQVSLWVHDDGPGFPAELSQDAFERFVRGDAARTRTVEGTDAGTGLGLALVRAIAEAHGGTASLSSAPGDTTVTVTLPG